MVIRALNEEIQKPGFEFSFLYESLDKFHFFFLWALAYLTQGNTNLLTTYSAVELMTPGDENKAWWEDSHFTELK